jgi:predicted DNA-binding transcriptional regulator YafY
LFIIRANNKYMEKHYGQIVEYLVRKNGYSITDLATELDVNRRSIYNYFQNAYLKSDIIFKIGRVIRHDFSKELPEFFTPEDFAPVYKHGDFKVVSSQAESDVTAEELWKDKYLNLLESYNEALLKRLSLQEERQSVDKAIAN